MTIEEYHDALARYREKFDEPFPLYMALGIPEEQIVEAVDECIKSGKEYEPKMGRDIIY